MSAKYRWSHATESAELDGAWVVMNADRATLAKLSGVGGYIWSVLREPLTVDEIVDGIISEYAVAREVARSDADRFLQELAEIGAVEKVS